MIVTSRASACSTAPPGLSTNPRWTCCQSARRALALLGLQRPELVLVVAFLALLQLLLGLLAVAGLGDPALVLGAELLDELLLLAPARQDEGGDTGNGQ